MSFFVLVCSCLLYQGSGSSFHRQFTDLNVGSASPYYVVAQVDFVHFDEEETWLARQEFFIDLEPVVSLKNCQKALQEFEKLFTLYDKSSAREQIELKKAYFTAKIILDELKQLLFASPLTAVFFLENIESHQEIIEIPSTRRSSIEIPSFIWKRIFERISHFKRSASVEYVFDFFKKYHWEFELNIAINRRIRDRVSQVVPARYTQTKAGALLLSKGEVVKNKHLRLIEAMSNTLSSCSKCSGLGGVFGSIVLAFGLLGALVFYLYRADQQIFYSSRKFSLLLSVICTHLLLSCVLHRALIISLPYSCGFIGRAPPFSFFLSLLLAEWYPFYASCAIGCFCNAILAFILPVDSVKFLLVNTVSMISVLVYGQRYDKKKDLLPSLCRAWFFSTLVLFGFDLMDQNGSFWLELSVFSLFIVLLIACAVIVINPTLEILFSVVSKATLEGYLDPRNPLLQRLSLKAPGTYRHSLFVSYFAEQAALEIGANSLLCKVAGLYHDIGKVLSAMYFTENQHEINIHEIFLAEESAKIIIGHVAEGVKLADQYELPESVTEIIREHHGTGLVYYFYYKARTSGLKDTPEENFRYPGPKPTSKEAALVMISDCFEAASRSLEEVSEEKATSLIDSIIVNLIRDHQLEESPIRCRDLGIIKKILVKTFLASTHSRIKYPARE